jgi:hypothetical protein
MEAKGAAIGRPQHSFGVFVGIQAGPRQVKTYPKKNFIVSFGYPQGIWFEKKLH